MTVIHQRRQFRSGTGGAEGLLREVNPGPLAPEARIMPLDQAANDDDFETETFECTLRWGRLPTSEWLIGSLLTVITSEGSFSLAHVVF